MSTPEPYTLSFIRVINTGDVGFGDAWSSMSLISQASECSGLSFLMKGLGLTLYYPQPCNPTCLYLGILGFMARTQEGLPVRASNRLASMILLSRRAQYP